MTQTAHGRPASIGREATDDPGDEKDSPQPAALNSAAAPATAAAVAPLSPDQPWASTSLQQLRADLQEFAAERDWGQYHTPRNLLLALVGEAGELAECFQWKGEVVPGLPGFSTTERRHIGEELSDVLLYLVRLADACGIDLAAAAVDKMGKNAAKYPAELCRGSSAKYNRYTQQATEQHVAAAGEQVAVDQIVPRKQQAAEQAVVPQQLQ